MKRTLAAVLAAAAMFAATADHGNAADSYRVRLVRCGTFAEDATAHVRLVRYDVNDGTAVITYRCERKGY